ncbi:beta-lactamase family protein [Aquimarina sp. U1-2]|nr:beta-lactamase family protein [Aquimarina sp. U1-2]
MLSLLTSFCSSSCSQPNQKTINAVDGKTISTSQLDRKIDSIIKAVNMPGISIAIVNDSELMYHNTFGIINSETKEPVDERTIFEGASLSKPIFAYFVMKMVEKGKLDLDKPLYKYLPHPGIAENSKEDYKLITARLVLSHQTGFPNHSNGEAIKLPFRPGTDFLYSGEAFQYLAAVIAKQNGLDIKSDLNKLFQKEVTEPLNMPHSSFVWDKYLAEHKAFGHDKEGNPTQNNPSYGGWSGKTFNAFSSLHSEAKEYAQFLVALLRRKGLAKETFNEMLKEHTRFKEENPLKQEIGQTGWGLGMAQKPTKYGMMHMHTGNNHDFQSYMMVLPEKKFGIVFFTNSNKAIPFIQALNTIIGPVF